MATFATGGIFWVLQSGAPWRDLPETYAEGPFHRLTNQWVFERMPGGCRIDFYVDFEFKSRLMQRMIEVLFSEAVRRMVGAFEKRARDLYDVPLQKTVGQAAR